MFLRVNLGKIAIEMAKEDVLKGKGGCVTFSNFLLDIISFGNS